MAEGRGGEAVRWSVPRPAAAATASCAVALRAAATAAAAVALCPITASASPIGVSSPTIASGLGWDGGQAGAAVTGMSARQWLHMSPPCGVHASGDVAEVARLKVRRAFVQSGGGGGGVESRGA